MALFSSNKFVKNPPTDDSFVIVNALYSNKLSNNGKIEVLGLTVTVLELIKKNYIVVDISKDINFNKLNINSKKFSKDELDNLLNIKFRLTSKTGKDLKVSEKLVLDLLKSIANSKKFNLKELYQRIIRENVSRTFISNFNKWVNLVMKENNYDEENYSLIKKDGSFTSEGKESAKNWKYFKNYLENGDLNDFNPSIDLDNYLIYSACFAVESSFSFNLSQSFDKDLNSHLFDLINCGASKALTIIFNAGFANFKPKDYNSGTFYGGNNKGFVPGF